MTIARIGSKLVYFAHIPKTGGTSVQKYLQDKGPLAMHVTKQINWSKTSPQHIHAPLHALMFPPAFLDASFAVMRNPLNRFISEYKYQMKHKRRWPEPIGLEEWAEVMRTAVQEDAFAEDNHIRPQVDFLRPGMQVFQLENGLPQVMQWIDKVTDTPASRTNFHRNKGPETTFEISPQVKDIVAELYAKDIALITAHGAAPDGFAFEAGMQNL